MNSAVKVFDKDKDSGGLQGLAKNKSLDCYPAFGDILGDSSPVVFVHITDADWKTLCENLAAGRTALRFSSSNSFHPQPPEGLNSNCFSCLKPIKGSSSITNLDFEVLLKHFGDPSTVATLRFTVSPELRGLISYTTPHRLRALHILLQACMVEWSNDGVHRNDALELLGCAPAPLSSGVKANRLGLFYRVLTGRPWPEIKLTDDESTKIKKFAIAQLQAELEVESSSSLCVRLVKEVFDAIQQDEALSWESGSELFKMLDTFPGVRR